MAITIETLRGFEILATDDNGDKNIFPRDVRHPEFAKAYSFRTKQINNEPDEYCAFPDFRRLGSAIVGIFSSGPAHADSEKQVMARSDDEGLTWSLVDFYINSTGVYNFSLLTDLLAPGETATFKTFTVKNTAGVFAATVVSTVSYGDKTYALWSRVISGPSGKLWRTGYAVDGGDATTALLESSDGGLTWAGKAVMFTGTGKYYAEADLVNTSGSTWVAVCPDRNSSTEVLYTSISTDDGATWGAATAIDAAYIHGNQANLIKITNGSLVLCTGDRTGTSGYAGSAGDQVFGLDTTGISMSVSTDGGATWGYKTRLSPVYSSDGGQPMAIETTTANTVLVVFYTRKTTKKTPIVSSCTIKAVSI